MNILITGETGFIGQEIVKQLIQNGDTAIILSRNIQKALGIFSYLPQTQLRYFQWDPMTECPPKESLENIESVINLMGENLISKRWNKLQKQKIYDSRIIGTENLIKGINQFGKNIQSISSASALGIYPPPKEDEIQDENSPLSDNFLGLLCQDWEKKAKGIYVSTAPPALKKT